VSVNDYVVFSIDAADIGIDACIVDAGCWC